MSKKYKKSRKSNDFIEIYGFHAVNAALKNSNRTHKKLIISFFASPPGGGGTGAGWMWPAWLAMVYRGYSELQGIYREYTYFY